MAASSSLNLDGVNHDLNCEFHKTLTRKEDKGKNVVVEGDQMDGNTTQMDGKVMQTFQNSFVQVQNILDQNRLLINEINQNHETKMPDNLSRNVGLIKELNNNIRRVVDLYADLSTSFTKSIDVSSEGDSNGGFRSDGKASLKRLRP